MSTAMSPSAAGASSPSSHAGSGWSEHRNAQGRVYWYHKVDQKSVWEKPSELKSAREKALDSTPWKEYQSGDRKYYVHSVTKESSWTLPQEVKAIFDSLPESHQNVATPPPPSGPRQQRDTNSPHPQTQRPIYAGPPPGFESPNIAMPFGSSTPPAPPDMVSTPAPVNIAPPTAPLSHRVSQSATSFNGGAGGLSGEEAFIQLLREKGVDRKWTWEQTMREVITEPLYKALKTLAERKAAFSKYMRTLEEEAETQKKQRAKEIEPSIRKMMQSTADAKHLQPWLSFEGMLLRCPDPSLWRTLEEISEAQARSLWSDLSREAKEAAEERKRISRRRNKDVLLTLLNKFEADVRTRWKDAYQTVLDSQEWQSDATLREMDMTDMISVFDDLMRRIEEERKAEMKGDAKKLQREGRIRRDWFRHALQEGKQQGWLTARTTFGQVYERFRDEKQFQDMLGQPGSTPLDLFYDVLDDMDVELEKLLRLVQDVLESVTPAVRINQTTTLDEFKQLLESSSAQGNVTVDERVKNASDEELSLLHEELVSRAKEEERRIVRKLRHLSEDVRYAFKKIAHHQPELFGGRSGKEGEAKDDDETEMLDRPWPEWRDKLESMSIREWRAFEQTPFHIEADRIEEARKAAWERFVARQKEKLAERRAAVTAADADDALTPRKRRGTETGDLTGADELALLRKRTLRDDKRRERRAGYLDEPSVSKRARKEGEAEEESEKEEGEV